MDDTLWMELKRIILLVSPRFMSNLEILLGRSLRQTELCTVLLIKCHFSPTDIALVLGRTKGTISNKRITLGGDIFNEKVSVNLVDDLIRKL